MIQYLKTVHAGGLSFPFLKPVLPLLLKGVALTLRQERHSWEWTEMNNYQARRGAEGISSVQIQNQI